MWSVAFRARVNNATFGSCGRAFTGAAEIGRMMGPDQQPVLLAGVMQRGDELPQRQAAHERGQRTAFQQQARRQEQAKSVTTAAGAVDKEGGLKKRLFWWAIETGKKVREMERRGGPGRSATAG